MKNLNFDPNFFLQVGLDSGALTMHGVIVHSFSEPGEYRGTVRRGNAPEAEFYIHADKNSPIAHVNIDLATLVEGKVTPAAESENGCCDKEERRQTHFVVNPKGYAVFHVTQGAGGYSVNVRKAQEDPHTKVFDSRKLDAGDIFSAIVMRPGVYAVSNLLTQAKGELVVSYPKVGKTAYRPPNPVVVECGSAIEPRRVELQPGQGLNFHLKEAARIKIELIKPDDGPNESQTSGRSGWTKGSLPQE